MNFFYEKLRITASYLSLPHHSKRSVKTQWLSLRLCSVLSEYELIPHGFERNLKMNGTNYSLHFLHHSPAEMGLSRLQIALEDGDRRIQPHFDQYVGCRTRLKGIFKG